MKPGAWHTLVSLLALASLSPLGFPEAPGPRGGALAGISPVQRFALPTRFEANQGQFDANVRFMARGGRYALWLTDEGATLSLHQGAAGPKDRIGPPPPPMADVVLTFRVEHPTSTSTPTPMNVLETRSNYFVGNVPEKWHTDVPNYGAVKYAGVLPGVDLVYHGEEGQLEYDFVVAPGASPDAIAMSVRGGDGLSVDAEGNLLVNTAHGVLVQKPPVVFQTAADGARQAVKASYRVTGGERVAFAVAEYDRGRELVIDPTLSYSTYLGGTADDSARAIALDPSNNAYVAGYSLSTNFPLTAAYQTTSGGAAGSQVAAFVAKLNSSGTAVVYSTYLGGTDTEAYGIAVDSLGYAYVTGYTTSTTFPRVGAYQTSHRGGTQDAFVTKISSSGNALTFSTYLGGPGLDHPSGIAVDSAKGVYVTGYTSAGGFGTAGSYNTAPQGMSDAFVAKLSSSGATLAYSALIGGTDNDDPTAIAVDGTNRAYIVGTTGSAGFPNTGAFQTSSSWHPASFITRLNSNGTGLEYSSYIGGLPGASWNTATNAIAVDGTGAAYVTGATGSHFPVTGGGFQTSYAGGSYSDAFVAKINSSGSALVYASYLGGSGDDTGRSIAVDSSNVVYVTGDTSSSDFNAMNSTQGYGGGGDAFVARVATDGSSLVYSTYLGGSAYELGYSIAVDSSGSAYVSGGTNSTDFPIVSGPHASRTGATDSFIARISTTAAAFAVSPTTATVDPVIPGNSVVLAVTGGTGAYAWSFLQNQSGATLGSGSANKTYTAGTTGGATDIVQVQDTSGHSGSCTITVNAATALAISPTSATVTLGNAQVFNATGGVGSYTWSVTPNPAGGYLNQYSGASVTYFPGAQFGNDTVTVTDTLSHTASAIVTVPKHQTWVNLGGPQPTNLTNGAAPIAYDTLRERAVFFENDGAAINVWEWDGSAWTLRCDSSCSGPSPRYGFATGYYDGPGGPYVMLYGGRTILADPASDTNGETWTWDGVSWSHPIVGGSVWAPGWILLDPSSNGSMACIPGSYCVWFGGALDATPAAQNFTLVWDGSWHFADVGDTYGNHATHPTPRSDPAMAYHPGLPGIMLYGGYSPVGAASYGDTWSFTPGGGWTDLNATGPAPVAGAAMAYDVDLGLMLMHGGNDQLRTPWASSNGSDFNDTWSFDGSAWAPLLSDGEDAALGLHGRHYASMAYDSVRHGTLMFGGVQGESTVVQETWATYYPPTGTTIFGAHATRDAQGVLVDWTSANSPSIRAFDVYRSAPRAQPSQRTKISPMELDGTWKTGGDRSYTVRDATPGDREADYWIASTSFSGGIAWSGPLHVDAVRAAAGEGRDGASNGRPDERRIDWATGRAWSGCAVGLTVPGGGAGWRVVVGLAACAVMTRRLRRASRTASRRPPSPGDRTR